MTRIDAKTRAQVHRSPLADAGVNTTAPVRAQAPGQAPNDTIQLDAATRKLLSAREPALPSGQYDGSQAGVLKLLAQQAAAPLSPLMLQPEMNAAYSTPSTTLLAQLYGPQAAMQMLQLELAMVRMEMALMAAMHGAGAEQVQGFLRDPSPRGQQLAEQLISTGQMLRSGSANAPALQRQLAANRQGFASYVERQVPMDDPDRRRAMIEQELGVRPPIGAQHRGATQSQPLHAPPTTAAARPGGPAVGARFAPFSSEARALFREAARKAGVPEAWADSPGLHNILKRESGGVVGRPNYTYGARAKNPAQWSAIHNELKSGRIRAKSSATGLGQLLLRNVDRYYPSGRAGIGDPVEEAAGMLAYIKDRYGSPERAWALYGKLHEGY